MSYCFIINVFYILILVLMLQHVFHTMKISEIFQNNNLYSSTKKFGNMEYNAVNKTATVYKYFFIDWKVSFLFVCIFFISQ